MNPKIARDPYLRVLHETHGEGAVHEAGWFDDADPDDASLTDVDWLCTPTSIARTAFDGPARPVVLLSTGAFHPVHAGHLTMMERARAAVEATGRRVIAGYLSPGHDAYIRHKLGRVDVPASERLARAAAAVAPAGWLSVDPWEALARRVAVNFTDVAARLETYLRHHVGDLDVWFVCGGDNARFALSFAARGGCVVVARPGSEPIVERWRADPRLAAADRLLWTTGDDPSASSLLTRPAPTTVSRLALRLEDERAVLTLGLASDRWRVFQGAVTDRLAQGVTIETLPVLDADDPAISLDPLRPTTVNLGVSRLFDLGGYAQLGHVARPGTAPLAEQLAAIPPGSWRLLDDDRATGGTLRFVLDRLPPGVLIEGVDAPPFDGEIADSRDFLLGADDGGLVVALPDGTHGRAPYLLPYADPGARAGVADPIRFSRDVWRLAADALGDRLLQDLPEPAARTLRSAGFDPDTSLRSVCASHAARLDELLFEED